MVVPPSQRQEAVRGWAAPGEAERSKPAGPSARQPARPGRTARQAAAMMRFAFMPFLIPMSARLKSLCLLVGPAPDEKTDCNHHASLHQDHSHREGKHDRQGKKRCHRHCRNDLYPPRNGATRLPVGNQPPEDSVISKPAIQPRRRSGKAIGCQKDEGRGGQDRQNDPCNAQAKAAQAGRDPERPHRLSLTVRRSG